MKALQKNIYQIFRTSIFIGVLIFLFSCENDIKQIQEITSTQDSAIIACKNIEINYTTLGKSKVVMKAPTYNQYIKSDNQVQHIFPDGINIFFYDNENGTQSTISAKYSIYYEEEGIWEAMYDVIAVNEKGERLNTEYLIWKKEDAKISSDKFVKMTTKDGVIYGDGFVSNEDFTSWEIINGRGVMDIENE